MTTTGEQLVTLSGLPSGTAMQHLQAIEVGGGADIVRFVAVQAPAPLSVVQSSEKVTISVKNTPKIEILQQKPSIEVRNLPRKTDVKEAKNAAEIRKY